MPHFSNLYGRSDPTHRHTFGLYSFQYLCAVDRQLFPRKVPAHYTRRQCQVVSRRLVFRGETRLGNFLGRAFGNLVNTSTRTQSFYERCLCWIVPCYAVEARLQTVK